jgi:hypothetical protein
MEDSLLSILGTIIQAYASILGIVGMYLVFLKDKKDDKLQTLKTKLEVKCQSLLDFINYEIAPAYGNGKILRTDVETCCTFLDSVDEYEKARKTEIPNLGDDDIKRLITFWAIVKREKVGIKQLEAELKSSSNDNVMKKRSSIFFVAFFILELLFAFVGILLVSMGNEFQSIVTQVNIIVAIIGLIPMGLLFFNIK